MKEKGTILDKKFKNLYDQQHPRPDFIYDEECVVNQTKKTIPKEFLILLSFGPKFRPPIEKQEIPIPKYIADLEFIIETVYILFQ